jgi:hypothetical protein
MIDELTSIEENETWSICELPPGHKPIGLKWVYKLKRDADGNVLKHKARLVAKFYVQRPEIDFDEVFAHVARLDSVRLLLAIAAQHKWQAPTTEHMSVVKQLLRYIAGTINHGCSYTMASHDARLIGFSDADMAGDIDDRKSTSGTLFFFGNYPVSWQCQKQKVVSMSSCESEYIAAATAACQGVRLGALDVAFSLVARIKGSE